MGVGGEGSKNGLFESTSAAKSHKLLALKSPSIYKSDFKIKQLFVHAVALSHQ